MSPLLLQLRKSDLHKFVFVFFFKLEKYIVFVPPYIVPELHVHIDNGVIIDIL